MDEIVRMLVEKRIATHDAIRGCSEEEVKRLEEYSGTQLPQAYREFLLTTGNTCDNVS